jgi:hypothetical protein
MVFLLLSRAALRKKVAEQALALRLSGKNVAKLDAGHPRLSAQGVHSTTERGGL